MSLDKCFSSQFTGVRLLENISIGCAADLGCDIWNKVSASKISDWQRFKVVAAVFSGAVVIGALINYTNGEPLENDKTRKKESDLVKDVNQTLYSGGDAANYVDRLVTSKTIQSKDRFSS